MPKKKHIWPLLIVAVILWGIWKFSPSSPPLTSSKRATAEAIMQAPVNKKALQTWTMERVNPPRPPSGAPPDISTLAWPPTPSIAPDGILEAPVELRPVITKRLQNILGSGILPELAEIAEATKSGELRIFPGGVPTRAVAMFRVAREGNKDVQYLQVSPHTITAAETPQDILYIALALAHEWRHKAQWEELGRPALANFTGAEGRLFTDEECSLIWHLEADAYFRQCHTLYEWGMEDQMGDLCHSVGRGASYKEAHSAFNWFLWRDAMRRPLETHPECAWRMATEAGHPHPEAFQDN